MIKEIPLPIPLSVTCSPSHIISTVPVTSVNTVITIHDAVGSKTIGIPLGVGIFVIAIVSPNDCIAPSISVPYLVICVSFLLPCSPSFANLSK